MFLGFIVSLSQAISVRKKHPFSLGDVFWTPLSLRFSLSCLHLSKMCFPACTKARWLLQKHHQKKIQEHPFPSVFCRCCWEFIQGWALPLSAALMIYVNPVLHYSVAFALQIFLPLWIWDHLLDVCFSIIQASSESSDQNQTQGTQRRRLGCFDLL